MKEKCPWLRDKLLVVSFVVCIITGVASNILGLCVETNIYGQIILVIIFLIFITSIFFSMYAIYTIDIRSLIKMLNEIEGVKSLSLIYPKDLIKSILLNHDSELKLDNNDFYNKTLNAINRLDKESILFALTRIKLYRNPMTLKDTVISIAGISITYLTFLFSGHKLTLITLFLFYGVVFLTWYFSNRKKIYICEVLEIFLTQRLSDLEANVALKENRKICRKYPSNKRLHRS